MYHSNTYVSVVRNVNEALRHLMQLSQMPQLWREVSPRGMETWEYRGVFITEYTRPRERVLFSPVRDANPFFHFMEALWIMDGRDDVAFLNQFNSNISTYSDDGVTFNAPYGYRLRRHFLREAPPTYQPVDQLAEVIDLLYKDTETRRAVLCLWDPGKDLNQNSRDIPCNDLVAFKLREGVLDMTVMNRSNDAMWGAYGANAVQFSFLQEFVACALDVEVGHYRQVSDSFHVYTSQAAWQRCCHAAKAGNVANTFDDPYVDQFDRRRFRMVPLMEPGNTAWREWLEQNHLFLNGQLGTYHRTVAPFFRHAAVPMMEAWHMYKNDDDIVDKNTKIDAAQMHLREKCLAEDWSLASIRWLDRRRSK